MATVNQCDRCNKVYPMHLGGSAYVKVSVTGDPCFQKTLIFVLNATRLFRTS